jgi:hypothetical protein
MRQLKPASDVLMSIMSPFNLIGAAKQNQLKVESLTALTSSQALQICQLEQQQLKHL